MATTSTTPTPLPLPSSSISTPAQSSTTQSSTFTFPTYTHFPPLYTVQPNLQTRARQLDLWSSLILSYTAHHHIFRLSLSTPPADLFTNPPRTRTLKPSDIRIVLDHMALQTPSRIEWLPPSTKGEKMGNTCWVYWKTLAEWADVLYGWVEETGQKGAVLTVYELREGDAVMGREWVGMDEGMLRKVLGVLVKRGKAQVFGQQEGEGVKFF
ncbi:hypothetical protein LTR37_020168 [Vermiconidia calcicola]|uniref:Uncharacterized protein n=1 Tax=Vermiconidia calcicola TaxID=1690605 RepID=A0ACC3MDC9_9PEZI|nr:hypothetical protein LTR37_020168 [Vermiconidia calcicola]